MTRPGAKVAYSWTLTSGPSRYVVLSTVHEPSGFLAKASHGKLLVAACALRQQACNAIAAVMDNATPRRMIDLQYPVRATYQKIQSVRGQQRTGCRGMALHQLVQIEVADFAVLHDPASSHHDSI